MAEQANIVHQALYQICRNISNKPKKKEMTTYLLAVSCHSWGNNSERNTSPDFPHRSCKSSPCLLQDGLWQLSERSLSARYQFLGFPHFSRGGQFQRSRAISTEEANFYGGGQFLRRRAISTEEADFYGGGLFLRRRLISTEQGNFYATGLHSYEK